jgi:hypothetical protein
MFVREHNESALSVRAVQYSEFCGEMWLRRCAVDRSVDSDNLPVAKGDPDQSETESVHARHYCLH